MYNVPDCYVSYDGTNHADVENNICVNDGTQNNGASPNDLDILGDTGSIIKHNTRRRLQGLLQQRRRVHHARLQERIEHRHGDHGQHRHVPGDGLRRSFGELHREPQHVGGQRPQRHR